MQNPNIDTHHRSHSKSRHHSNSRKEYVSDYKYAVKYANSYYKYKNRNQEAESSNHKSRFSENCHNGKYNSHRSTAQQQHHGLNNIQYPYQELTGGIYFPPPPLPNPLLFPPSSNKHGTTDGSYGNGPILDPAFDPDFLAMLNKREPVRKPKESQGTNHTHSSYDVANNEFNFNHLISNLDFSSITIPNIPLDGNFSYMNAPPNMPTSRLLPQIPQLSSLPTFPPLSGIPKRHSSYGKKRKSKEPLSYKSISDLINSLTTGFIEEKLDTKRQDAKDERQLIKKPYIRKLNKSLASEKKSSKKPAAITDLAQIKIIIGVSVSVTIALILIFIFVIMQKNNALFAVENSRSKYIKRPKIAVFHPLALSKQAWEDLKANYNSEIIEIQTEQIKSRDDFLNKLSSYKDLNILVTSKLTDSAIGSFDEQIISNLPSSTVAIINSNLHYNACVINSLTDKNIQLSYSVNTELKDNATADTHIFLMLSAMRNYQPSIQNVLKSYDENSKHEKAWSMIPSAMPEPFEQVYKLVGKAEYGFLPNGKVLGILGMNGVGKQIVVRARAFGFQKIIYFDDYKLPSLVENQLGLEYVEFDMLVARSDVISVNLVDNSCFTSDEKDTFALKLVSPMASAIKNFALDEQSLCRGKVSNAIPWSKLKYYHIINSKLVGKMKNGVVLINTASHELIDFKSIKKQIKNKKMRAFGMDSIDFHDKEALSLLLYPNVILTPETSLFTQEVIHRDDEWVVRNIKHFLENGKLLNLVPEQRYIEFNFDFFNS